MANYKILFLIVILLNRYFLFTAKYEYLIYRFLITVKVVFQG